MEGIVFILVLVNVMLYFDKYRWKKEYYKKEDEIKKIMQKQVHIIIEKLDNDAPLEENIRFIKADNIIIHNADNFFYKSLEQHREFYEKIVTEAQMFKEMLEEGMKINDIRKIEEYEHSVDVCFNHTMAIMGYEENGKIHLINGRHRCMVAKELEMEVPIFITERYITKKIEEIL